MSHRIVRTPDAEHDLLEIWLYIAADSPAAADRLLERFEQRMGLLADFPELGPERSEIRPGLRQLSAEGYVIFYAVGDDEVVILNVRHGARDLSDLF